MENLSEMDSALERTRTVEFRVRDEMQCDQAVTARVALSIPCIPRLDGTENTRNHGAEIAVGDVGLSINKCIIVYNALCAINLAMLSL